ncbi:MAG: DinB family protein [Planctomycetota bacterium]|jgi:hypothetical protein
MRFGLEQATEILARTPATLRALLQGLSPAWVTAREGSDTWSPFDVVGHLIHGERTDWIARARIILARDAPKTFEPFDRRAHLEASRGRSLEELLDTFASLRARNLRTLERFQLTPRHLERTGEHPDLGTVTLRQLLATWAVHDLAHLAQIARVMAKQYAEAVGPWRAYLPILGDRPAGDS